MTSEVPRTCPACQNRHLLKSSVCPVCDLPLDWIAGFPEFDQALRQCALMERDRSWSRLTTELADSLDRAIPLAHDVPTILGREKTDTSISLPDSSIDPQHCLVAPYLSPQQQSGAAGARRFFLVDLQSQNGTFVNRERIEVAALQAGDFIQIGPFAWSFSAEDGHLIPLPPIAGLGISLEGYHLKQRLGPNFNLRIEPGELTAVVGESGAGKSTLIKVLAGTERSFANGHAVMMEANGQTWPRERNLARFRASLAYVSQDSVLHEELSCEQLLHIGIRLRRDLPSEEDFNRAVDNDLLRFELEHRRDSPICKLSGGENKRLRVAQELLGEPRLLILDEPDSGLDQRRRRQLMRLLRARSWQGCTVVLVTHDVSDLEEFCDRIVRLEAGQIVGDISCRETSGPAFQMVSETVPTSWWNQTRILLQRETQLQLAKFANRLILPIGVAFLFALAIGTAVPRGELELLGFLAFISCIWMSASLSLLSIAGERAVFDHERLFFLRISTYLTAKSCVLLAISTVQTAGFLGALAAVRWLLERDFLDYRSVIPLLFVLVGWSGVSLGLFLSALAQRRKEAAIYVLPLVIVAQIVFSIPIVEHERIRDTVENAYREFHGLSCENGCGNYASVWQHSPEHGQLRAVCTSSCKRWPESHVRSRPDRRIGLSTIRWAALASYLTISRPADIALRQSTHDLDRRQNLPEVWQGLWPAFQVGCWFVGLIAATALCLYLKK